MSSPTDLTVVLEIADGARISPSARIGAFCVIGPDAVIGPGTILGQRVTVVGRTLIGRDNHIAEGCVLGAVPQDLKYRGGPTYLIVGDRNRFDINVTAHVGTEPGGSLTRIGNDNRLDWGVHVGHDCYVDDRTHLGAMVLLGGHVRVETGAVISQMTGAHHFTTLGAFSLVDARTPIRRDVPPFTFFTSLGYYAALPAVRGVHEAGLAAAGLPAGQRRAVREAIEHLFADKLPLAVKVDRYLATADLPEPVRQLCEFCRHSVQGRSGRYRELFRGRIPPEAWAYLPPPPPAAGL